MGELCYATERRLRAPSMEELIVFTSMRTALCVGVSNS